MIETLKLYDLIASNWAKTLLYIQDLERHNFNITQKYEYRKILHLLTSDMNIPITTDDVVDYYKKLGSDKE